MGLPCTGHAVTGTPITWVRLSRRSHPRGPAPATRRVRQRHRVLVGRRHQCWAGDRPGRAARRGERRVPGGLAELVGAPVDAIGRHRRVVAAGLALADAGQHRGRRRRDGHGGGRRRWAAGAAGGRPRPRGEPWSGWWPPCGGARWWPRRRGGWRREDEARLASVSATVVLGATVVVGASRRVGRGQGQRVAERMRGRAGGQGLDLHGVGHRRRGHGDGQQHDQGRGQQHGVLRLVRRDAESSSTASSLSSPGPVTAPT